MYIHIIRWSKGLQRPTTVCNTHEMLICFTGISATTPNAQLQHLPSQSSSRDRVLPSHSMQSTHPVSIQCYAYDHNSSFFSHCITKLQAEKSPSSRVHHSSPQNKVPSVTSSVNVIPEQQVSTSREERLLESSPHVKKKRSRDISNPPPTANSGTTLPVSSSVNRTVSKKQGNLPATKGISH